MDAEMDSTKHELSANFTPEGDLAAPPRDTSNMSWERRSPLFHAPHAVPTMAPWSLADVCSDDYSYSDSNSNSDRDSLDSESSDSGYEFHYYNNKRLIRFCADSSG